MKKEKKGLFGRLLDFWREKLEADMTDGIGFWNDTKDRENHFAEMGAVAALAQEDTKKVFWEELTEDALKEPTAGKDGIEQKMHIFYVPKEEKDRELRRREEEIISEERKRPVEGLRTVGAFLDGKRETEEATENGIGKSFLWEMPDAERIVRTIIPVSEEATVEKAAAAEEVREIQNMERPDKEEKRTEANIDIEKLMRQMTKKLWEEREGCSRRLR